MAQNSSFPWSPCRWLHFPCLGDGNFSALLPVSIIVHFSPKTLKSLVSCFVTTTNPHFLLCFKPKSTSFVLFFASFAAPPAFLPEIVFLLWAGTSVHPVILHYTVTSPVSVSEVVLVFSWAHTEHHLPFPSSSGVVSYCLCPIQTIDPNISPGSTYPNSRELQSSFNHNTFWIWITSNEFLWPSVLCGHGCIPCGYRLFQLFELWLPKPFLWAGWDSGTDTGAGSSLVVPQWQGFKLKPDRANSPEIQYPKSYCICCFCGYPCFIPPALHPSEDQVLPGSPREHGLFLGLDTRLGTQNSGSWNEPAAETQVSWGRSNPSAARSPPQPLEDSAAPAEVSWEMASCGFPSGRVTEALWVHGSSGYRARRYWRCVKDSDCLLFQLHSGICKRQTGRNAAQNTDLNTHI